MSPALIILSIILFLLLSASIYALVASFLNLWPFTKAQPESEPSIKFTSEDNVNFVSGQVGKGNAEEYAGNFENRSACQEKCKGDPDCFGYTYDGTNVKGLCYKSLIPNFIRTPEKDRFSGMKYECPSTPKTRFTSEDNIEYVNEDTRKYYGEVKNRQACLNKCKNDTACNGYTFVSKEPDNSGKCYGNTANDLKRASEDDHYAGMKYSC